MHACIQRASQGFTGLNENLMGTPQFLCPGCKAWSILLAPSPSSSNLFSPSPPRYANTRHPAVRYSAYVRQRPPLVLLCLLHLWDRWCAALGRAAKKQMFPGQEFGNVSTAEISCSSFLPFP